MTMKTITYNPETHVIVPRELDNGEAAYIAASLKGKWRAESLEGDIGKVRRIYRAMIAAVPEPQQEGGG